MTLLPSSSSTFKVFISHGGEDKETIALPLRAKLQHPSCSMITAFVDDADIPMGRDATQEITASMVAADMAVIVLSPEFVAKEWPMKELLFFLKRREAAIRRGKPALTILPVFYRLSLAELYQEPNLSRTDAAGKSLYRKTRFLERMDNGEPEANIENIKRALRTLHQIQGVENKYEASNDKSSEPSRNLLLADTVETILEIAEKQRSLHPRD